jgi:DNA-binding NtrC family response regulator
MKVLTEADSKATRNIPAFPTSPRFEREAQDQPAFSVAFTPSTPMKEIHDAVIQTVLRYTHGNRSRAAELLQINPRTIRRHLGRKETPHSTALAG